VEGWSLKTHASTQDDRVLSVVSDDDEPVGDSQRIPQGKTKRQTNVFAASASTFSRNWQAPPPLMQFNSASTLQSVPLGFRARECDVIFALTHPRRRW